MWKSAGGWRLRTGEKVWPPIAARHALAYGFDVSNFDRIVAIAQSANRDSLRVMERIGMRFERKRCIREFGWCFTPLSGNASWLWRSEEGARA